MSTKLFFVILLGIFTNLNTFASSTQNFKFSSVSKKAHQKLYPQDQDLERNSEPQQKILSQIRADFKRESNGHRRKTFNTLCYIMRSEEFLAHGLSVLGDLPHTAAHGYFLAKDLSKKDLQPSSWSLYFQGLWGSLQNVGKNPAKIQEAFTWKQVEKVYHFTALFESVIPGINYALIPLLALNIYKKTPKNFLMVAVLTNLRDTYHKLGQFKLEALANQCLNDLKTPSEQRKSS